MKQKPAITFLILLSLAALFIYRTPLAGALRLLNDPQALIATLRQASGWSLAVLVSLLILQVFLAFIPGQALMVASGYLYGFWGGALVTWLSLSLGGQLAFWLARRYGKPFASRFTPPAVLERWDRATAGQGIAFYTVALVLPLFPNDAMCYVAGLGQMQGKRFLVANLLGRLIASLLTAFVGAYGSNLPPGAWLALALFAGLGMLVWKFRSFFQTRFGGEECQSTIQA